MKPVQVFKGTGVKPASQYVWPMTMTIKDTKYSGMVTVTDAHRLVQHQSVKGIDLFFAQGNDLFYVQDCGIEFVGTGSHFHTIAQSAQYHGQANA